MIHIDAKTRVCALFGHPVGHSLSPQIHNAAFEALGLPFVYVAHDVQPGQVGKALEGVRAMGYRGLSVTIPHKVEAMQSVDQVDPTARGHRLHQHGGRDQDGRLLGYNSDGLGALGALRDAGADPRGTRALVLGSGGAARAIAMTLALEAPPAQLAIMGIEVDELEQLVEDVRQRGVSRRCAVESTTGERCKRRWHPPRSSCIVRPSACTRTKTPAWFPPRCFADGLVVFDAVYNPRRTPAAARPQQAGCRTIEGLEMFLGQAYVQFELWTGQRHPADVMRQVVEARL